MTCNAPMPGRPDHPPCNERAGHADWHKYTNPKNGHSIAWPK